MVGIIARRKVDAGELLGELFDWQLEQASSGYIVQGTQGSKEPNNYFKKSTRKKGIETTSLSK